MASTMMMRKLVFVVLPLFGWLIHPAQSRTVRMAISRPFSEADAHLLPQSFEAWATHPPCRRQMGDDIDAALVVKTDLLLVFSQTLESSLQAQQVISEIKKKFHQTQGWGKCILTVEGIGVGIHPDQDIYDSKQQDSNPLWVNGPNRLFERTVRFLQRLDDEERDRKPELMYLMESDSVPVRDYWLDALVEEFRSKPLGFAILGR
jgi:hypothetical protein